MPRILGSGRTASIDFGHNSRVARCTLDLAVSGVAVIVMVGHRMTSEPAVVIADPI